MTEAKRSTRVATRMRDELSGLLLGELRDPRLREVLISRIEVTDDLGFAKIYVRTLRGVSTPAEEAALIKALTGAASFFRRELASLMKLRTVPELRFAFDSGQDARQRVEELLEEIKRESK